MYLKFFRLNRLPFALSPDPAFLYLSASHVALLNRLRASLVAGSGVVAASGKRGSGKTLLLEALLGEQNARTAVARIDFPPQSLSDLARIVARQLDLPLDAQLAMHSSEDLARTLAAWRAHRRRLVLCFDNAHLLSEPVLAAVVSAARPGPGDGECRVILAGQGPVADCAYGAAEQLSLAALRADEVAPYIEHRLAIAGWSGSRIFQDDTFGEIASQTRCNPRIVNALCDAALGIACERELRQIRLSEIQRAMEDVGRMVSAELESAPAPDIAAGSSADSLSPSMQVLARVRLTHKGVPVLERDLTRGKLQIGRAPDSDLQIESHFVSRHHCQILTNDELSIIEDVRSTNGLYVNERRVRYHRLSDGDTVLVGEHELRYEDLRRHA